jgi:dienelactone hydrolase
MTSREQVLELLRVRSSHTTAPAESWGSFRAGLEGVSIRSLTLVRDGANAIPCLFLAPPTPAPWPGAVAVHQHNVQYHLGKSEPAGLAGDPNMRYALELAKRGVAVIVPDLIGFEERRGPWQSDQAFEQFVAMNLLAGGSCLQAKHVEDVLAAVSWMDGNAEIEGALGMIGHSLGGQVTLFATACDPRIRASVISCGLGTIEGFRTKSILHNPSVYVPGIVEFGDMTRVASAIENQAVFVAAGSDDVHSPLWAVRDAFEGFASGTAQLEIFDGPHDFPPSMLCRAANWLASHLVELRPE